MEMYCMDYLIGIDIGTSNTKVVLYDTEGNEVRASSYEYSFEQPKPKYAEQDPEIWWTAVCSCLKDLGLENEIIKGIGVTGQMHGLVMLDESGKPLRKSILWCDQRTEEQVQHMDRLAGKQVIINITGNPAMTGFTASKLLWVKENEPHLYARCKKIMVPKDYIVFRLTGVYSSDVTDASGMQLLDINTRNWSSPLIEKLGFDVDLLCPIHESMEIVGSISQAASIQTGLSEGIDVIAGAGDQAAAAIGNGIIQVGTGSINVGSSGVLFAYSQNPVYDKLGRVHTMCHALPNTWHVMAVTQGAGLSLKWFKEAFYAEELKTNRNIYDFIDKQAEAIETGSEGLIFLPYLMGERSPLLDSKAKGIFFGITPKHTKMHFSRSIMEGVGLSFKDCFQVFKEMGIEINGMRISGGGSKSKIWTQIIADCLMINLVPMQDAEAGTKGMAMLSGVATGVFDTIDEAVSKFVHENDKISFDKEKAITYNKIYQIFKNVYLNTQISCAMLDD